MTRRRYIQDRSTGELIEVTPDYVPANAPTARDCGALWGDRSYDGLQATDGADISTRTKHREYMKRTGLTTVDDFSSQWARQSKERQEYMTRGGSIRKTDIERAISQLTRTQK